MKRPAWIEARTTAGSLLLLTVLCLIGFAALATAPTTPTVDTTAVPANPLGGLIQDLNANGHSLTNASTVSATNFAGNAAGLTNFPSSVLTTNSVIATTRLSGTVTNAVSNASVTTTNVTATGTLTLSGTTNQVILGTGTNEAISSLPFAPAFSGTTNQVVLGNGTVLSISALSLSHSQITGLGSLSTSNSITLSEISNLGSGVAAAAAVATNTNGGVVTVGGGDDLASFTPPDSVIPTGAQLSTSNVNLSGNVVIAPSYIHYVNNLDIEFAFFGANYTSVSSASTVPSVMVCSLVGLISGGNSFQTSFSLTGAGSTPVITLNADDESSNGCGAIAFAQTSQTVPLTLSLVLSGQYFTSGSSDSAQAELTANNVTNFTLSSVTYGIISGDVPLDADITLTVDSATTVSINVDWYNGYYSGPSNSDRKFTLTCNATTLTLPGWLSVSTGDFEDTFIAPLDGGGAPPSTPTDDAILSLYYNSGAGSGGSLTLGGSSATPDATGQALILDLVANGVSVTTN